MQDPLEGEVWGHAGFHQQQKEEDIKKQSDTESDQSEEGQCHVEEDGLIGPRPNL